MITLCMQISLFIILLFLRIFAKFLVFNFNRDKRLEMGVVAGSSIIWPVSNRFRNISGKRFLKSLNPKTIAKLFLCLCNLLCIALCMNGAIQISLWDEYATLHFL